MLRVLVKRNNLFLLALVLVLALVLRFYQLGSNPSGALVDEAHFGYLAHSLNQTGRDEHGQTFPLIFKGFGDDKLPLQVYLMMPVVKLFGLNNFSLRFWSAISGVGVVLAVYLISHQLTKNNSVALMTSLAAALTPWSLVLSRFGYESHLALLLFSFGLWALLRAVNLKSKMWWFVAVGLMAATWYGYVAYRLITFGFLLIAGLLICRHRRLGWKTIIQGWLFYLILVSPFILLGSGGSATRFTQLFGDTFYSATLEINEARTFCQTQFPRPICDLVANKPVILSRIFVNRFFSVFSSDYLVRFGEKNLDYLSVTNFGPLLYPSFFLFLVGIGQALVGLVTKRSSLRDQLLLTATFLAPLPAVLVGDPQKVRMSGLLVLILSWSALGLQLGLKFKLKKYLISLIILATVYLGMSFYIYFLGVHTQRKETAFGSHLPRLFSVLNQLDSPEKLIVTLPIYSDLVMYYAYFNQVDPQFYQDNVVLGELEASGFQHAVGLDRLRIAGIEFEEANCLALAEGKELLYVTDRITKGELVAEIKSINGVHRLVGFYQPLSDFDDQVCRRYQE
ncbi:MAG: phospholipid carrier-dependent glycosyltransferase [Candidatus Pacebacteria bacterium]|nr:phospholipid carrier-dependent glycosyltransferase [Candidatus Paceibacterota bacterium]